MSHFITDEQLASIVKKESGITHMHNLSVAAAQSQAVLIRLLITGHTWEDALQTVQQLFKKEHEIYKALTVSNDTSKNLLSKGGYAPDVLKAAIYFVNSTKTFLDALHHSLSFAGSANYCPVLVGALAGARYGASVIPEEELQHLEKDVIDRVKKCSDTLSKNWK